MTRRLTLLRHAKSSWDNPSLDDFDRPLNPRGQRAAPEMGRRLAARNEFPDLICSSPANRAITTARAVAEMIDYPEHAIREVDGLYHASPVAMMQVVHGTDDGVEHLMLCGHNPGLTSLANALSDARIDNLPTAGLFCVEFDEDSWAKVTTGKARFAYFDYPKNPFP